MKKGSEAGATLRDGAADLWRKGVAMTWRVLADCADGPAGAHGAHPHMLGPSLKTGVALLLLPCSYVCKSHPAWHTPPPCPCKRHREQDMT